MSLTHKHSHSSFFHSHAHDSHSDSEPEVSSKRAIIPPKAETGSLSASNVALIGLGSNLCMLVLKAGAGYHLHSSSLMADALHSGTDLVSDLITYSVLKFSGGGKVWPFGTGKIETLGSLAVHASCMAGGVGIAAVALQGLGISVGPLAHVHSHGADVNAVWFALLGLVAKESLYRITKKVADQTHSPVLLANANHHRSDAWASLIAVLAILGSAFAFPALDAIGGILVSAYIIFEAFAGIYSAAGEVLDKGVDVDSYKRKVEAFLKDSATLVDMKGRKSGGLLYLEVTIELAGNSFNKAVKCASDVKRILESRSSVGKAVVLLQKEETKPESKGSVRKIKST